jgi:hypothetical protein
MDIPLPVNLQNILKLPPCADISLPPPKTLKISLPTGGELKSVQDISRGIPTDCSLTFSLLLQIGPILASMACILKMLSVIKPLIDIINGLTKVPPAPPVGAIKDFVVAADDLVEHCFLMLTPAGMIPFLRDILCLILAILRCLLGEMKTIAGIMQGLTLQMNLALESGNTDLQNAIACAQQNASNSANSNAQAIDPIVAILDLLAPIFGLTGQQPISLKLPPLGSNADAEALNAVIDVLQTTVDLLQDVTTALGGCGG